MMMMVAIDNADHDPILHDENSNDDGGGGGYNDDDSDGDPILQ